MKKTLQHVLAEYGTIGLVLYLVIFFVVLGGFLIAMWLGWEPAGTATRAGTVAAAYVATKLTLPLRIAATVMLTPLVARLYDRMRGAPRTPAVSATPPAPPAPTTPAQG